MKNIRMIRRRAVEAMSGRARSAIYEMMAEGTFPKNVPIGKRAVGWVESEVQQWIADQITEARKQQAMEAKAEEVAAQCMP